ncbi:hypothetical protein CR159_13895 [Pollutimonas subterranea]|uniref:Uncharacterized protein n=1 Tax=Pollutimonas subterranea TaxID=2045210 RepID=A0A2N4U300_9BURK|nr:hypothetical protein [Pollutimonas subterranea]PLC49383.1 hypothetical protein CR159_13895 [Pollutimonas subterranea]
MRAPHQVVGTVFRKLTLGVLSISALVSAVVDLATPVLSFSKYLLIASIALLAYYSYLAMKYPTYAELADREKIFSRVASVREFYQESWRWGTLLLVGMVSVVFSACWYLNVTSGGGQGYLASHVPALHDIQARLIAISDNQEKILEKLDDGGITIDEMVVKAKQSPPEQRTKFLRGVYRDWYVTEGTLSARDFIAVMRDVPPGRIARDMSSVWASHCEPNDLTLAQYIGITGGHPEYFGFPTNIVLRSMIDNECMKLPLNREDLKTLFDKSGDKLADFFDAQHNLGLCDQPMEVRHLPMGVTPEYEHFAWEQLAKAGQKVHCLTSSALKELQKRHNAAHQKFMRTGL